MESKWWVWIDTDKKETHIVDLSKISSMSIYEKQGAVIYVIDGHHIQLEGDDKAASLYKAFSKYVAESMGVGQ